MVQARYKILSLLKFYCAVILVIDALIFILYSLWFILLKLRNKD